MFKIGDVVKLKSGGSEKTVTKVGERKGVPHVWCTWENAAGRDETGFYPAEAVELATKKPLTVNRGPPGGSFAASRRG
jgi:uncharacterized protein YodC (DUF2158 family)